MTTIRLGVLHPTGTADDARSAGVLEWVPSARRVVGTDVVLPDAFRVALSADADVTVVVAPTTTAWVWRVREHVSGGSGGWRYLAVPDSAEVVDYADLVEVDPATLDPVAVPEAAWWAAADGMTAELALKAALASPAFTGTPTGITKAHVGLGSVDNTSDAGKPVSTAQGVALGLKLATTDLDATVAAAIPDTGTATGAALAAGYMTHFACEGYGADPAASAAVNIAAINAATAAASTATRRAVVTLTKPGIYLISDHVLIYSNTKLELGPGVTIKKANGVTGNVCMLRNANMQSTDSAIEVCGGTWDGNQANNQTPLVQSDQTGNLVGVQGDLSFIGVSHLYVHDVTIQNTFGFGIQAIGNDMRIEDIDWGVGTRRDGVHINGPSARVKIRNISGYTHDDFIALNAWDWSISSPSVGDITDVTIENVAQTNAAAAITAALVKFLPGTRAATVANVRRVSVSNASGFIRGLPAFAFYTDTNGTYGPSGAGVVSDVMIRGVSQVTLAQGMPLIELGCAVTNLTVDGVDWDTTTTSLFVKSLAGHTTNNLDISGFVTAAAAGAELINVKGTIDTLKLTRCHFIGPNNGTVSTGSDGLVVTVDTAGTLSKLIASDCTVKFGGSLLYKKTAAAAATTDVTLTGCAISNVKRVFFVQKPVTVRASACSFLNVANDVARVDGAAFVGRFAACDASYAGGVPFTNTAAGGTTIRVVSADLPVNVLTTTLNAQAAGDLALNSNAALACGAGAVVFDGTHWKNLYTGAVYPA